MVRTRAKRYSAEDEYVVKSKKTRKVPERKKAAEVDTSPVKSVAETPPEERDPGELETKSPGAKEGKPNLEQGDAVGEEKKEATDNHPHNDESSNSSGEEAVTGTENVDSEVTSEALSEASEIKEMTPDLPALSPCDAIEDMHLEESQAAEAHQDHEMVRKQDNLTTPEEKFSEHELNTSGTSQKEVKSAGKKQAKPTEIKPIIPRGLPKSGRVWKTPKEKFSRTIKTKGLKTTWEKKMELKKEWKKVQSMEREIKEAKQAEIDDRKQQTEEKKKRKLENERKAEIVQVIKNPAKIKRMKKKQLRQIEKRDTTQLVKAAC